jgi:geranylgeranyl pyrophosphate synthase
MSSLLNGDAKKALNGVNGHAPRPLPVPDVAELERLLAVRCGGSPGELLTKVLLKPIADLVARPGKRIRGRLVEIGYAMASASDENAPRPPDTCQRLAEAIELLHAGSLAVDDVQDGSTMRRGEPSLHLKYGLPVALNTGNALYFWPLEMVRSLGIAPEKELAVYRVYHRVLVRAHVGQALDLGLAMNALPQERAADVCLSAMELKSGALFSLALMMGGVLGGADEALLEALDAFGHKFGCGLQMFDDLGNLKGRAEPAKRWEDLILRRPTWVWACAAKNFSPEIYGEFIRAVNHLPNDRHLQRWFDMHDFLPLAKTQAREHMAACFASLETALREQPRAAAAFERLCGLKNEIAQAYE